MADRKISELVALTTPAAGDYLPIIDISEAAAVSKNKRITIEELLRGAPDGTAAAPSIAFESDGGNGLYLAATDTIGISTNGVSRATISTTAITSALPIALSGSTSGSVTLTPVAVAGTTTITLPATTGTVVTTGDSGTVTSTMIANGTIVDADVNASAAIAGTKISPNFGSQTVQTTGIFSHALGAVSTPSITFTGDLNTGIWSPAADTVAASTGGSESLRIDSSGRVGIGATSVTNLLHLRSDSSSNVDHLYLQNRNGGANSGARIAFSNGSVDYTDNRYAYIGAINTGALENGNHLVFATNANGVAATEKVRITSAGLVGVGTSSPSKLLTIGTSSTANTTVRLNCSQTAGSDTGMYSFGIDDSTDFAGMRLDFTDRTSKGLQIFTAPGFGYPISFSGSSGNQDVTIDTSGRVGIGTTAPSGILHTKAATNQFIGEDSATGNIFAIQNTGGATTLNSYLSTTGRAPIVFTQYTTEAARIDSSGRLLVGTSSSSAAAKLIVQGNTSDGAAGGLAQLQIGSTTPASGAVLGRLDFSDSAGYQGAWIRGERDGGTWTSGSSQPGRLVFSTTADGASSPTEALRITNDRVICYNQPAPASFAAAATLTVADLKTGIIQYTGAAATLTLPTGTLTEAGFSGVYTNMTFEWSLINTGTGLATIGAGTNHTIVGLATCAQNNSARFATRRTAANTFVSYRIV